MKLRLGDLKRQGDQFVRECQYLAAVRVYVAVLRRSPEDYETRLNLADALAAHGATLAAGRVYMATADLCITGGRPLIALVACQALQRLGGSAAGQLTRLSVLYGRGSARLATVGARLNASSDDLQVDARELRRELSVQDLITQAVQVGGDLAAVGELPLKFAAIPLLSELSPVTLVRVARRARVHRLPAGAVVFREGDMGTGCYLLARGKVRIVRRGREMATLSDGAVFGEMAVVSGSPRSATVVTVTETDLFELGPDALAAMGDDLSRIAPALDSLARRRWISNMVQDNPMFQVFSEQERRQLLLRFEAMEVPRGTVLVEQGEQPRGLYILVCGEVASVVHTGADAVPRIVERMGSGSMPGLESVMSGAPAMTAMVAITPVTVLFLSGRFFRRLAAAVPEVLQAMQGMGSDLTPGAERAQHGATREISHACC